MVEETMGLFSGFVFSINVMIGAGFLGLPYSFSQTGIVLSLIYLILLCLLNNYLSLIFLEVMHKAFLLKNMKEEGASFAFRTRDFFKTSKLEFASFDTSRTFEDYRIDASVAMSVIFGRKFGIFYLAILTICFEGTLVAYASIFATSLADNIPLITGSSCNIYEKGYFSSCLYSYWIFLFFFSLIVVILTLIDLKEQRVFQIVMCIMRFTIMSLVIFSCISIMLSGKSIDSSKKSHASPALFKFSNTEIGLPIIIFALLYQLQMPSVTQYVKDKKSNLWKIISLVSVTSFVWYGALGLVVPYAIDDVAAQVSLNFADYSGGKDYRNIWDYTVSYIVLLFPAFDVLSSYPLASISIADNWKAMVYGEENIPRKKIVILKLIFSVIPLIISFFLYDIVIPT